MDFLVEIKSQIFMYFTGIPIENPLSNLIKKHSNNLCNDGDFSFPLDEKVWHKQSGTIQKNNTFLCKHKGVDSVEPDLKKLIEESRSWLISLTLASISKERCVVFLDRPVLIRNLLNSVLNDVSFAKISKDGQKVFFENNEDDATSITVYRAKLVKKVITNLLAYSQYIETDQLSNDCIRIDITSNSTSPRNEKQNTKLLCGSVIDPQNNKAALISPEEYIRLRCNDMQLIAMHKYGVRARDEKKFQDLIGKLGKAGTSVDLLEVRHTKSVTLKRNGQGSTKGASFILYNSARIETLLRIFVSRSESKIYEKLPEFSEVDLSLLSDEEEWELIFNYVLAFPSLIKKVVFGLKDGDCSPHLLLQFLNGFVSLFSIYYRRVRILMDNRTHLIPVIHARIYLIKSIRIIINIILNIFDIEPVQFM